MRCISNQTCRFPFRQVFSFGQRHTCLVAAILMQERDHDALCTLILTRGYPVNLRDI